MTVLFKTLDKTIDLEAHPDYEGIKNRFYDDFEVFVRNKKIEAVIEVLKDELGERFVLEKPEWVSLIMERVDEDALQDKPYVMLSVNEIKPQMLI